MTDSDEMREFVFYLRDLRLLGAILKPPQGMAVGSDHIWRRLYQKVHTALRGVDPNGTKGGFDVSGAVNLDADEALKILGKLNESCQEMIDSLKDTNRRLQESRDWLDEESAVYDAMDIIARAEMIAGIARQSVDFFQRDEGLPETPRAMSLDDVTERVNATQD